MIIITTTKMIFSTNGKSPCINSMYDTATYSPFSLIIVSRNRIIDRGSATAPGPRGALGQKTESRATHRRRDFGRGADGDVSTYTANSSNRRANFS